MRLVRYDSHGLARANDVRSGTVCNPTPGDDSELDPHSIIIGEEEKSEDAVGVTPNAVVADDDAGDWPAYTASELDLLWKASTTVLHEW